MKHSEWEVKVGTWEQATLGSKPMIEWEIAQQITFKGETKAREKEKKWAVSENLYLQVGIVINTVQLEHELHDLF